MKLGPPAWSVRNKLRAGGLLLFFEHLCVQHIFNKNPISACRILNENVCDGAHYLAVLQHRAAGHSLDDAAGGVDKLRVCYLDYEAFVGVLVVHIDSGDFGVIFLHAVTYVAQDRGRTDLKFLLVSDFHFSQSD